MSGEFSFNSFSEEHKDKSEKFDSLCKEFSEEIDCHLKTKILHSLVQTYLSHFKEQLETNMKKTEFLELLAQIPFLCCKFLRTSYSKPCSLVEISSSISFEDKNQNLESALLCFDAMFLCSKAFCVSNQCMIIAKISLNILSQGYTHCKESEAIYGDELEQFANQLGIFFKKIENLQMIVLQQLDQLDVANDPYVNSIVLEMGNLCQVVFSLDADVAFDLWAKYIRILTDHATRREISNINSVTTYLALKNIEILEFIQYDLIKNSEEDEELSAKFSFYLDALSSMVNLVPDSFKETVFEFQTFLLNLLECLILCYSPFTPDKPSFNIIKNSLLKNTAEFISHLYSSKDVLSTVLINPPGKQAGISLLLLKLCALQFMKSSSLQLKKDFFTDINFEFLSSNSEDEMKILCISVPRCTLTSTQTDESVTLYQFAYEQITEFLKLLPDSVIKDLEYKIIGYLESSSDVTYLLMSDVWMYRLRCSSLEFLRDRCFSVLQNLSLKNTKDFKIESLVKRMLKFLPASYKDTLLDEFCSLKFIQNDHSIKHRFGIPDCSSSDNEIFIHSEKQINSMMNDLSKSNGNDVSQLVQKACTCLELCTLFLSSADCAETLQYIEFAFDMFATDVFEIQIAVLTLIKAVSGKSLPEHTQEFGRIVTFLTLLFSKAMHSKNYIVTYEARSVFSYFAKCTPHTKIVQETVRRDPTLKPLMKSYINSLPENGFLTEKEKAAYLTKQISSTNAIKFEISEKSKSSLEQIFSKCNFQLLL